MNERQSPANGDSAVILFGPGGYCALTDMPTKEEWHTQSQ